MLGVYGGTFNPVHYGHLRTALEVKQAFELDEIRLIPCHDPPHRGLPEVDSESRLQMLQLAVKGSPGMNVDRRELDRNGPSYMVDTLRSLRAEFPHGALFLFIGTDAFSGLEQWHQWQHLFDYAHIVVMTRPGYQPVELSDYFRLRLVDNPVSLQQSDAGLLCFQAVTQLEISASAIRELINNQHDPRFLLPDNVITYINQHKLYRSE
jgi:nicotinate-nucleotide adenylyltransferase